MRNWQQSTITSYVEEVAKLLTPTDHPGTTLSMQQRESDIGFIFSVEFDDR